MIIMFNEKVVLVTGGTRGIGYTTVEEFLKEGARVILFGSREESVTKAINSLKEENNEYKVEGYFTDLANLEEMEKVAKEIATKYGKIDILVNNAAVQYECTDIKQITDEQFDKTMKTNVYGTFYMTREVMKYLKSGGCIINTTSVTAFRGNDTLMDYSMTKGAILTLTRSLSMALAKGKTGIRVNSVAPGPIWTPLIPSSFSADKIPKFGNDTPMGRAGQPVECAGAYVFLASEAASYITGQTIHINGGEIVNS